MAPSVEDRAAELALFLDRYREGPHPILWVGAGASAAAGYPTLAGLETVLRRELPGIDTSGYELADAYVAEYSRADLAVLLQRHLGVPRGPAALHAAVARLAGVVFRHIFTTNYDRLLEDALTAARVSFVPQVLEANSVLQGMDQVQLLKLHGDLGDWMEVVLTTYSYREYERTKPLLAQQLNLSLRTHPVVFVGCSMTDPRLLDWLRALSPAERGKLFASRAVLTEAEWARLPEETQKLLASANIKPVLVPDYAGVTFLFQRLAEKLAPLPVHELVFDLDPGETTWTVTGPTPESPAHAVPNPLKDPELVALLTQLKESVSLAVPLGHPQAALLERQLELLALQVSQKLTPVLLSEAARPEVLRRINKVDRGRPRLVLRVADASPRGDQALALPWELLAPQPGEFAVRAGRLDILREAVVAGAPGLPEPSGPLTVAVTVAAPEDQGRLNYESESFRLQAALSSLGQKAAFADLGGVDDLVEVVEGQKAAVVHFSGHGLPGHLVFEDDYGFSQKVPVADLVDHLHRALPEPGSFPRLFFLASCHGVTEGSAPVLEPVEETAATREPRSDLAAALGEGPSTAAVLHRSGFVQVIGYFGPVGDELCTRAEEAFYRALAEGRTTLQAVSDARETLAEPLEVHGDRIHYPLGWAQLAIYHRGADRPLALGGEKGTTAPAERFRRRLVQVSGLPVLEQGFIGRRALQHDIRRRVEKEGRRLIILQGLGGLGKTALASQLLAHTFAPEPPDQLILRCRVLEQEPDPASILRAQAEEHGRTYNFPGWDERMKRLQEAIPDPAPGFAAVVREIRKERPGLALYADNTEILQDGPKTGDPLGLGSWLPEAAPWWKEMEGLAQDGLILASTRYFWKGG